MKYIGFIFCFCFSLSAFSQDWKDIAYENGDLLFQDIDCGDLCDAIEKVTPALDGKHFSHIGLVYKTGDSVWVVEAIGKDVHVTSLPLFLQRQQDANGNPKVVLGRLKPAYQKLCAPAVRFALQQIGKPYDDSFLYNNRSYYCSELIYDAFKEANRGEAFFNLYPMTFKDPATGKTFPAWKNYYRNLRMRIPEGRQGCNPGSIAISDSIDIIASFY